MHNIEHGGSFIKGKSTLLNISLDFCGRSERQELCDVKNYQIKARDITKKKRVFASLYAG